jgi:hypothetical protein
MESSAKNLASNQRIIAIVRGRFLEKRARVGPMSENEKDAPVSRRSVLRGATVMAGGAATAIVAGSLAPASAQSGKMTQQAAAYQNGPKDGQKCLDCSFYVQPQACKLVEGTISPVGWCKFYAKKAA